MPSLAHIVNVTEITDSTRASYLHVAQPLTLKTMAIAKDRAQHAGVAIELVTIKHQDEVVEIPADFLTAPDITTYAWEHIPALRNESLQKPLPRLTDILGGLYDTSTADYFIFTNLDIGVYPDFYVEVHKMIERGFDAICINRRSLPKEHQGVVLDENHVDKIFAMRGVRHPGIDCAVFSRDSVPKLQLGNVFVGFPPVGLVMKCQIENNASRFRWVKNRILTFHIGQDRAWRGKNPYFSANLAAAANLYTSCFPAKPRGLVARVWRKLNSFTDH